MYKEAQQAAGGLISLGETGEDGAHPQLSSGSNPSVLVDKTKSAGDGLKTAHTTSGANEESRADDISRKVKLEDLSEFLKDTRSAFFTPNSPTDEPIIVSDVSEEEENAENDKDTEDTSVPHPSPKSAQIQELMAQPKLSKLLASHDFASCLPTELKELPSKITRLSREIKELKHHIKDMEIELPVDLIEIPTKLESFTSTISSLSSQVAELKNIQWKPPTELLNLPSQISSVQEKLKTLDFLPNLLHKVSDTLNRFSTVMENASGAASMDVPSADQAPPSPAEGEKNTKDASTNLKNELIDLVGKDVVTRYYTKKLLFDKYYDKMLKRKKNPNITNCKVLTKKGPIKLKIYREDGSEEVILNFKVSDLHSTEWREVLQACPDKSKKGWKTIYDLVLRRLGSNFTSVYAAVQKLKKDSWLGLQFSLADNSKLNVEEYELWESEIKQFLSVQMLHLWEGKDLQDDVKARSLLLMALPNEHQLTFNQYVDAQSMFIAIKARFGGNDATKKTQKALLKQHLPSEWDTHVVVWMNKPDFETMGLDDLYNNFKIVEQKVKRTVAANNDDKNLAFLTTSSPSSTNTINTVNTGVSTGNTKVNTASTETSTASFSDATMDLKWNMALLSMRARKFYQRTGRKIIIDGSSTAGYDKSKVECFNCHKMGHFARECRAPRRMKFKLTMALMDHRFLRYKMKSCSKSCLQNYEALKKQYDDLIVKLDDTGFKAATYKRGLSILEAQVVKYKESEVLFSEEIALLKRSVGHKEYLMGLLKTELEKVKEEKEGVEEPKKARENTVAPIIEDWVSDDEEEVEPIPKVEKKTATPTATKKKSVKPEKPIRRSSSCPNIPTYGSKEPGLNGRLAKKMLIMLSLLIMFGTVTMPDLFSTARSVNTFRPYNTAHPKSIVPCARPKTHFQIQAQSNVQRPFLQSTSINKKSNSQLNDKGFVDSGCSRHMSGNIAHLLDFKDFDGGYVTFGGGANGGRITGKGIQGVSESSTSSQQDQDCIVMPIWKDASYFDDASLKSVADAQIQDQDGTHEDCSLRDNGTADQQVNTASPEVNTGSREVSTVVPEVYTATPDGLVGGTNPTSEEHNLLFKQEEEPKRVSKALSDPAWVEAMQEEPLQFKLQNVWVLVDLPKRSNKERKASLSVKINYVHEILRSSNTKMWMSASTPTDLEKACASRTDIMFAVCACASDYAGATLDRKSTTGGCQFLGNRLISWQCKKQTVVATSTTEAEYVVAASCCGQVLWIQNQCLIMGTISMNTVILHDNTSTICIHRKSCSTLIKQTLEIRTSPFIRDCNTKKLIQMAKIDTQLNVTDLLTKGFDAGRFQYLVSSIGMLNL
ncbi:retrovirus-related pol polyprotein from transposon TNT 1-94 [Tanacetum coccineum]